MVKILVTGSKGQLGQCIKRLFPNYRSYDFTFIDIEELDLSNIDQVKNFFRNNTFKYIINCAAYTSVDLAEKEPEKAYAVNALFPSILGKICLENSTRLIHISTDYVYNGASWNPHTEEELTLPYSTYGKSKLDGEKQLKENPNTIIIRTSWLYSEFGNNFLKTVIRLSKEKEAVNIVFDQTGSPTYAGDIAKAIMEIITFSESNEFIPGIYNYSNEGVCSWYDFAVEILNLTNSNCKVNPIRTIDYPLPAKRPEYSVMDKHKIKNTFKIPIPHWRNSLINVLNNFN